MKTVPNTEAWYQWTYGVLFSNWNIASQGLALLDNGQVWASMENFPMASRDEQNNAAWVGTVSPDGAERKMGDLWARGPTGSDYGLDFTDTFAPNSNYFAAVDPSDIFTDGTMLYLVQQYVPGCSLQGPAIWSLDPETLELEYVAFDGTRPTIGDTYEDSHDAKQANAVLLRKPVYWNGAFYFWDQVTDGGDYSTLVTLRRWEPGGGVSTVTPSFNNPAGFSTALGWYGETNSTTGLPNSLNDDLVTTTAEYFGVAIHNDWMYIVGYSTWNVVSGGHKTSWIRRLDMNDPDNGLETLYYGLQSPDSVALPQERDWRSDFESSPNGVPYPTDTPTYRSDSIPGLGTPQLLGFLCDAYGQAAVLGDDLIFTNLTTATWAAGQINGQLLCAIDIPTLLTENEGGSVRHNRATPLFRTIANGSTNDHSYTSHNWKTRWAIWNMIDGGLPAFTHLDAGSLVVNPNADGWANKLIYMANSVDDDLTWARNNTGWQGHHIKVLEAKGSTDRDFAVEFSFEGMVLKGYGSLSDLDPPEAPEEIILQ